MDLKDADSSELNQRIQEDIDKIIRYLQKIANFRYHLLIYKLAKKGHVRIKDLAEDSGYSTQTIYRIIDTFDSNPDLKQ